MTLIASFRTADGIVIAGDSLATMSAQLRFQSEVPARCPKCKHEFILKPKIQAQIPASTFPYAQKVFPFLDDFGVGTFGAGEVLGKTMWFAITELESSMSKTKKSDLVAGGAGAVAGAVGKHIHRLLKKEVGGVEKLKKLGKKTVVGFQIVGYDGDVAKTVEVKIGNGVQTEEHIGRTCTVSGMREVVTALWDLAKKEARYAPPVQVFSLQDAINYVDFLIRTTSLCQQFSQAIPGVGGDIDIALVTPFNGFQWIRQKELGKVLAGGRNG
ncbi:hypothetical protein KAU37_08785 [Candidatus Bipolaricaulota bacterium]|nr:hypothetical protein [Candidatus Bipolaricaulota bacterium]